MKQKKSKPAKARRSGAARASDRRMSAALERLQAEHRAEVAGLHDLIEEQRATIKSLDSQLLEVRTFDRDLLVGCLRRVTLQNAQHLADVKRLTGELAESRDMLFRQRSGWRDWSPVLQAAYEEFNKPEVA